MTFTGPTASLKGRELAANPRAALTTWWDLLGRQVRIQGDVTELERGDWGGWVITPLRMESMELGDHRFHRRDLCVRDGDAWDHTSLRT